MCVSDIDAYMAEIGRVPLLTREEEIDLAFQARAGDATARDRLVRANLRFVVKVAHQWKGYGIPLADLVAEGNIGLATAATKFDPTRGFRFISFAVWEIRKCVCEYILRAVFPVRAITTQGLRRVFYRLREARRALGDDASAEAIATYLNEGRAKKEARPKDVEDLAPLMAAGPPVSFDYAPDGMSSLADRLSDGEPLIDDELGEQQAAAELHEEVEDALSCLSARDRYVVRLRHMADTKTTMAEIARRLGISREAVRQIEKRAMKKLRRRIEPRAA